MKIDFPPPTATIKSTGLSTEEASILKAMGPVPKAKAVAPQPPPAAKSNKQVAEDEDDEDDLMDAYRNTTATEALIPPDNKADDSEIQFKVPPVAGMLAVSSVPRCNFSVFHKTKVRVLSIYLEFHVEFNGHSPMNRNDPQQVVIFGPASLKNL